MGDGRFADDPNRCNFAGATLRQIDVAEKMTALIEKYHVSCEYLEVEVSESYSDMNQEMLAETSNKIRKSNVRVILDHFGAKESTVAILTIMEFDGLKIDKSIVTNIVATAEARVWQKQVTECLLSAGSTGFSKWCGDKRPAECIERTWLQLCTGKPV